MCGGGSGVANNHHKRGKMFRLVHSPVLNHMLLVQDARGTATYQCALALLGVTSKLADLGLGLRYAGVGKS